MSINFTKGLPQNNVRYRNSKKPEIVSKTKKIQDATKKLSVIEEMQQMKQRREDRKKELKKKSNIKKTL